MQTVSKLEVALQPSGRGSRETSVVCPADNPVYPNSHEFVYKDRAASRLFVVKELDHPCPWSQVVSTEMSFAREGTLQPVAVREVTPPF